MQTLTMKNQSKKVVVLSGLIFVQTVALTVVLMSAAQAAPKKKAVPVVRTKESIIAKKNPAIYDGPHYGGPIVNGKQAKAKIAAHKQVRVKTKAVVHAHQKAAH
ncbi:hypothetical protein IAD21_06331 [Abditibacteriota bacterium]|nr:hypothetical protein IAD21_06331 [Abditibacteriota bacterium]